MAFRWRFVVPVIQVFATLILAMGCQQTLHSELLDVREVGPDRVAAGRKLELRGNGFPVGRTATVRLLGTLHRPGRASRRVHFELAGIVASPEHIDVPMTQRSLRELGGRGTFRGVVEVSFGIAPESEATGEVTGRIEGVVFDLMPSQTELVRETPRALASLGIAGFEDEDGVIRVQSVAWNSEAERAGVRVGDQVVAVGGARIASVAELVVFADQPETRLELRRLGILEPFEVSLRLSDESAVEPREIVLFQLALLTLIGVWLMWGPGARYVAELAPRARPSSHRILLVGGAAAAGACVGRLEMQLDLLVLGIGAARALAAVVERGWKRRIEGVLRALFSTLAAGAAVGAAPAEGWDSGLGYGVAVAALLAAALCGPRGERRWVDEPNIALHAWIVVAISPAEWLSDGRVGVVALAALAWVLAALRDWGSVHRWTPPLVALAAFVLAFALAWLGPDLAVPIALRVAVGQTLAALLTLVLLRVIVSTFAPASGAAPLHPTL